MCRQTSRHGAGAVAENLHFICREKAGGKSETEPDVGFLNPKAQPPSVSLPPMMTYILQCGQISQSFQNILTEDQAFKHTSIQTTTTSFLSFSHFLFLPIGRLNAVQAQQVP